MNGRVLVLPKYARKGASSRLRTYQYLPFLEDQGWMFAVKPLFDEAYLDSFYSGERRSRSGLYWLIFAAFLFYSAFGVTG